MRGLYFEEFEQGVVFEHAVRRTVTEADNTLYCGMTLNFAPLHLDAEYAKGALYGQRLVNSLFVLGLVTGICMLDTTHGTLLATSGFEEVRFPTPVVHGDTIRALTEVVSKREPTSRNDSGVVVFRHRGISQRDEVVCDCRHAGVMRKRPSHVPGAGPNVTRGSTDTP